MLEMSWVGLKELSVPSSTQIYGYIPVLPFCPQTLELDFEEKS